LFISRDALRTLTLDIKESKNYKKVTRFGNDNEKTYAIQMAAEIDDRIQ
jgi:hypothetical protein